MSEEHATHKIEWFALEWLGVVIGNHFVGRTVVNFNVSFFNLVGQIKITNVEGTGAFSGAVLTVFQEKDSAFVVLVQNVVLDIVALGFHKELSLIHI